MKYSFRRERSEFWITVYKNCDNSYSITTNMKYVPVINVFFPLLKCNSPTKWRESTNYTNMGNLWLPEDCYQQWMIDDFLKWCDEATKEVIWLGLNKNIREYFSNELDFCLAVDFNYFYGNGRTEIGEVEYQLKYNVGNLDETERKRNEDVVIKKMVESCRYIPLNKSDWCVSPMPTTAEGQSKLAWTMAEKVARQLELPFINSVLKYEKPQMKQLSVEEKIETWNEIYYNGNVEITDEINEKNVMVIDDLYQSGTTMWEYAKFLKNSGARSVWGLVCVKSLRDSDNR